VTPGILSRRRLRAAVGVLWLSAGALQLQPFMFTRAFAQDVLGSAATSQPDPLRQLIVTAEQVVGGHPALANGLLACAELLVGAALLLGRGGTKACTASVALGLAIWVVGEGLGGLLTGTGALSTGAPGPALLYALLTVAAWPRVERPPSARVLARVWAAVWSLGALLAFVPAQWGARGLGAQAAMGWMMSPHWTTGTARGLADRLAGLTPGPAVALSLFTVAVHAAVAGAVLSPPRVRRALLCVGAALSAAYWVFGQGFGGLATGTATDVGAGPVMILLAVALLLAPSPIATTGHAVLNRQLATHVSQA
jgi:hypothetical protein